MNKKKFFVKSFPSFQKIDFIPVSIKFTQLPTQPKGDGEELIIVKNNKTIVNCSLFQTTKYELNRGFYKPISKIFNTKK